MAKQNTKSKEAEVEEAQGGEVAVTEAKLPAQTEELDIFDQIEQDSGAGQENMTSDDMAIPRFGIIQSLSPQRQKTKPEYIEGAEEGMLFESVGKRLFPGDKGIIVIPLQFQKVYLEWGDRKSGKGLVKNHGRDATLYNNTPPDPETGKRITPDGNYIQPTAEYFVFMVDEETGAVVPGVLSMASVFLKHAKRWNAMINQIMVKNPRTGKSVQPPIYFQSYRLTTVPETNESGSWFRHEIAFHKSILEMDNGKELYERAKKFREGIVKGAYKVAEPEAAHAGVEEDDDMPM